MRIKVLARLTSSCSRLVGSVFLTGVDESAAGVSEARGIAHEPYVGTPRCPTGCSTYAGPDGAFFHCTVNIGILPNIHYNAYIY